MNMHLSPQSVQLIAGRDIDSELLKAVSSALGLSGGDVRERRPALPAYLESRPVTRGALAPWQAKRVARFIVENATAPIKIGTLAAIARLSTSHFSRAFRASFGLSPYAMICRHRVAEAARLMLTTDWPLVEIADACGFADQSHFSRLFSRHAATSPGRWRRLPFNSFDTTFAGVAA